ncbi:MAG: hypothetical protein IJ592_05695 [Candidatus Methanomethylophilaceae archaeon]|nr:hypothetical protein [Candidatus Methanomethylophilaceae archaeon]
MISAHLRKTGLRRSRTAETFAFTATKGNFAESTYKEKRRKLYQYSDIIYALHKEGKTKSSAAKNLTADDIDTYVTFRRSQGIKDSTICMGHDSVETTQKYYANYRSKKVLHAVHSQLSEQNAVS